MTTNIHRQHALFLGETPTEIQARLYAAFPGSRGYSDRAPDAERFKAVVVSAMASALAEMVQGQKSPTFLFVHSARDKWAHQQLKNFVQQLFGRCSTLKGDRVRLARAYREAFKMIFQASNMLRFPEEPKHWVVFGFQDTDPLPSWAQGKLLNC